MLLDEGLERKGGRGGDLLDANDIVGKGTAGRRAVVQADAHNNFLFGVRNRDILPKKGKNRACFVKAEEEADKTHAAEVPAATNAAGKTGGPSPEDFMDRRLLSGIFCGRIFFFWLIRDEKRVFLWKVQRRTPDPEISCGGWKFSLLTVVVIEPSGVAKHMV